jgi:galactokinase
LVGAFAFAGAAGVAVGCSSEKQVGHRERRAIVATAKMTDGISSTAISESVAAFARRVSARMADLGGVPVRCVVQARPVLDVMGGIAELSGGMTLSAPADEAVRVAVAPRDDQRLHIIVAATAEGHPTAGNGHQPAQDWDLSHYYDGDAPAASAVVRERMAVVADPAIRAVIAAGYGLLAGRLAPHLGGGFTVVVESSRDSARDAAQLAAILAATGVALLEASGVTVDRLRLPQVNLRVQTELLGWPTGIVTPAAPLLAVAGELLAVCAGPFDVGEPLTLPDGLGLLGIACGTIDPRVREKYAAALTAALMGREIVARLMPVVCKVPNWDGYLARVSVTDFVDQLRDCIPTKLKGQEYLDRFGPLANAPAPIDPRTVYKVRSRTEHHIYEDDRVRQFVERLARARRTGDPQPAEEAGELMYASHWSYGQRCGLGSIAADALVTRLRGAGPDAGIFGARVTGPGCGGTVIVLLRDGETTRARVMEIVEDHARRTGQPAALRPLATGGQPGLTVEPVR